MKGTRYLVGLAALTLTLGSGAMANEIYKWTDENGNVHYEDRPSGAASEQLMAMSYRRTSSSAVQGRVEAHNEAEAARQEARGARAEEKKAADEAKAAAEEKQQRCETYRARLESFVQSRRLYREDDDGERVYLDEKQTQDARQRVEELVAENCGS